MTNEQKIFEHYGLLHQCKKLNEECYELIEAAIVAHTTEMTTGDIRNKLLLAIAEELADCFVLMSQIRQHFGIEQSTITDYYKKKIERQLKRIEDETK